MYGTVFYVVKTLKLLFNFYFSRLNNSDLFNISVSPILHILISSVFFLERFGIINNHTKYQRSL